MAENMDEMEDIEVPIKAGSIRRISVENFMCHSSLTIELGDRVNFITGQNGSGKSAILTALCVAFGIKAKGTQRANSVKDFIKNGCRYASVVVELNNVGEDAFKPSVFGDTILVERRILDGGTSAFCVKDSQGRKVGLKKNHIEDIVEHFNIEVENPCVIMTQDKSREFLHGGSDKDKFKFFFKATLLQNFSELLTRWEEDLTSLDNIVEGLFADLLPHKMELRQIEEQLKTFEAVEFLRSEIDKLQKIYAWTTVKDAKVALAEAEKSLEERRSRIPKCQKRIDDAQLKVELKREAHAAKNAFVARMMNDTQELRQSQQTLQAALTEAMREKVQVDEDTKRVRRSLQETKDRLHRFEVDIAEMNQRMAQDTQAEMNQKLEAINAVESSKKQAQDEVNRLQEEESTINAEMEALRQQSQALAKELEDQKSLLRDLRNHIRGLQSRQTNTVTAFGGDSVLRLLQAIEENCNRFTKPPIGPIGAHVGLVNGDWSLAVEVAVGRMFNDFVVTNQRDTLLLRDIGNRVGFRNLGIITTSFDRPPIKPTPNDLPDGSLLTILGSLKSQNATIVNVLIDQGGVDQKVLVEDYNAGKNIAFNGGSRNVKEVITMDGTRMYTRAGAETTLFKDRRVRGGRLGVRVDEQIAQNQAQENELVSGIQGVETRKRKLDQDFQKSRENSDIAKRRRGKAERALRAEDLKLKDLVDAVSSEPEDFNKESMMLELEQEATKTREEMQSKEEKVQKSEVKLEMAKTKWTAAKSQLEQLSESARGDVEALKAAEQDLVTLEDELRQAMQNLNHYQTIMAQKVVPEIEMHEKIELDKRKEVEKSTEIAAQICPLEVREPLGEDNRTRDQLTKQMEKMSRQVKRQEDESEPQEQLIKKANKIRRKLSLRERRFTNMKDKLDMLTAILEDRKSRYRRNTTNARRELTWGFNGHLGKKGFSGSVKIDWENKTLNMSVQMPQDASHSSVRDTRALSGGERSFSTLAFALAVHNMTEAPFRAMDEFDVFMDAVSRKISLDTVVEFALQEGSQWIFITPHDISMVKGSRHVKKQQMPAPRP